MTTPKYKRVLLKLSGEALVGNKKYGIDDTIIKEFASQLSQIQKQKIELIIVIGGGNFFRGSDLEKIGIRSLSLETMRQSLKSNCVFPLSPELRHSRR